MYALDGNSIAGELFEHFGAEMTTAAGTCAHCGASALVGELRVYSRAPGAVVRCPSCGNVVIVLVRIRQDLRVETSAFRGL
jgi:uncharacterized Zn finger protein